MDPNEYIQDVINQGKGHSPRDTESGQLLIDRAVHLDVLEYLLWINRWGRGTEKGSSQASSHFTVG